MIRCPNCTGEFKPVRGCGPSPSEICVIGERPGKQENNYGKPFVGDTGQELDSTYLPLAGLERRDLYVTNAVKCYSAGNTKPTEEQVKHCAGAWLPGELDRCSPELLILLGATACSLVPKIRLDHDHGIPVFVSPEDSALIGGWSGWVFHVFHLFRGTPISKVNA